MGGFWTYRFAFLCKQAIVANFIEPFSFSPRFMGRVLELSGIQVKAGSTPRWDSGYVSLLGFGTLLKGTLAVSCSGTFQAWTENPPLFSPVPYSLSSHHPDFILFSPNKDLFLCLFTFKGWKTSGIIHLGLTFLQKPSIITYRSFIPTVADWDCSQN